MGGEGWIEGGRGVVRERHREREEKAYAHAPPHHVAISTPPLDPPFPSFLRRRERDEVNAVKPCC